MSVLDDFYMTLNRRHFLSRTSRGLGAAALAMLFNPAAALGRGAGSDSQGGVLARPHVPPRARRIIYLFQSGAPSQMELLDHKPLLAERYGEDLPASVRMGQRLTGMTANQERFPLVGSPFAFTRHGESGAEISELLPYTSRIADDLCVVRSMHTEAINHDPAITFFQTGSQIAGRPSMGAWLSYGLGSENANLPAFIVLLSRGSGRPNGQPLYSRLWGAGFLPSLHQGVQFRSAQDPVLYLNDLPGVSKDARRRMLDTVAALNREKLEETNDPEITTRIAQYEMAYRMQTSVPDAMDLSDEPDWVFDLYGEDARVPGTYAANCLLARRLAERDVRFVQLYHMGWDQHDNLPGALAKQCKDTDQASAALVTDLKQRGLLDDTLVVWGGEFGRTNYCQGTLTPEKYGRDHHPRCFSIWMAGGGVQAGLTYGATDEFGYNIVENPVHVHDFQATLLHLLGVDHERLTFRHQGRRFRLTDVHGEVVHDLLA